VCKFRLKQSSKLIRHISYFAKFSIINFVTPQLFHEQISGALLGGYALQRTFFTDQKINYGAYGGAEPAAQEMEQVFDIYKF
jgi:hypothetical protein